MKGMNFDGSKTLEEWEEDIKNTHQILDSINSFSSPNIRQGNNQDQRELMELLDGMYSAVYKCKLLINTYIETNEEDLSALKKQKKITDIRVERFLQRITDFVFQMVPQQMGSLNYLRYSGLASFKEMVFSNSFEKEDWQENLNIIETILESIKSLLESGKMDKFFLSQEVLHSIQEKVPELSPIYEEVLNFIEIIEDQKENCNYVTFSLIQEQKDKIIELLGRLATQDLFSQDNSEQDKMNNLKFLRSHALSLVNNIMVEGKSNEVWEEDKEILKSILRTVESISGLKFRQPDTVPSLDDHNDEVDIPGDYCLDLEEETNLPIGDIVEQENDIATEYGNDSLERIEKAYKLFKEGALSEKEYENLKQRILKCKDK